MNHIGITEAGVRLGLTYQVVLRLLMKGDLSGHRDGRHWRIDLASLERFRLLRQSKAPLVVTPGKVNV